MMTTTELAEQLGITRQCLNKYRRKLEETENKSIGEKQGLYVYLNDNEVQELTDAIPKELIKSRTQFADVELIQPCSALIPVRHTVALENKLTTLQAKVTSGYQSSQDNLSLALQRIDLEAIRAKNTQTQLSDIEQQQAINTGVNRAVKAFELEQQAYNAVLEKLRLEALNKGE